MPDESKNSKFMQYVCKIFIDDKYECDTVVVDESGHHYAP